MIKSFASKTTQDIFAGEMSRYARKIDVILHERIVRIFNELNAAKKVDTLRVLPSNRVEKSSGDLKRYWSVRVNNQWRVIIKWIGSDACDIDIVDYH